MVLLDHSSHHAKFGEGACSGFQKKPVGLIGGKKIVELTRQTQNIQTLLCLI